MGVKDYDLNPDNNTQINGINIAEGCPPSGINDAIRQMMADVKADSDAQNKKASTPASAEELGPVKVGDGLTMGEDGTLSLDLVDGVDSTSTTQAATANAVKTAYDKAVNALPVGALHASFASSISGCLLCNGAAVSRTTYAALFALLGTSFGTGDGSKTFNLPDFRNKTLWGANGNLMSILAAGLPNATGQVDILSASGGWDSLYFSGALYAGGKYTSPYLLSGYSGSVNHSVFLDLSKYNTIYGNSTTVQPPAIAVNIFIKY